MSEKKRGHFLDLFTTEVPDVPARHEPRPSPVPASPFHGFAPSPVTTTSSPTMTVAPDPAALAKLQNLLAQSVPPVYGAFMEQYQALAEVIPDEGTRFRAALKTSKASSEQLLAALDQVSATLNHARDDFEQSFERNRQSVVGQAESSLKATDELIASKEGQLKALQDELVALRGKRDYDARQLTSENQRLQLIRGGFEAAHAQVLANLNSQKSRITSMPRT